MTRSSSRRRIDWAAYHSLFFPESVSDMVANQHFQRLKHIYTSAPSAPAAEQIAIAYGRAELEGTIEDADSGAIIDRMPHHGLLRDAAALAAGSLEKEHVVKADQFSVDVVEPGYEGSVLASAEVVLVEPPRSVVEVVLVSDDGTLVAEARGVFRRSENDLPPDPSPDNVEEAEADALATPPPASIMPVHSTPYGTFCLN